MIRSKAFVSLIIAGLWSLGCGGGGGGSTPSASNPPAPVLHTAIVERLDGAGAYAFYQVKEDGTGWSQLSPVGINSRFLALAGDRIIYLRPSSADLWSCRLDGSNHVALSSSLFDAVYRGSIGTKVIFSGRKDLLDPDSYSVYSINTDGSGRIELDPGTSKKTFQAISGGKIFLQHAFTATDADLFVVDPDGSHLHDLSASSGVIDRFGYSDGIQVYYIQETDGSSRLKGIYAHNIDGSGSDIPIAFGATILDVHGVVNNRVVFSYTGSGGETWINSSPTSSGTTTPLFNISGLSATFRGFANNQVVFERPFNASDLNDLDIWACNADGSGLVPLAQTSQIERVESISGNRIIYSTRTTSSSQVDLRVVSADGSGSASLAASSDTEDFVSVLNNQVVYLRQAPSGAYDLYLVNLDGTGTIALTTTPESELLLYVGLNRIWFTKGTLGASTARAMVINPISGATPMALSDGAGFDHVVAVF